GHPVFPFSEAVLLEPGDRPARVSVEVAFLLGERLAERLVDEGECFSHGERLALGVKHLCITSVDRHARPDGGPCEVYGSDVAALQMRQRRWQLRLKHGDELAACGSWRRDGTRAAHEDDARGESVSAGADHTIAELCANGPRATDAKASADHG